MGYDVDYKKNLVELYLNGFSVGEISKAKECAGATVYRALYDHGISSRNTRLDGKNRKLSVDEESDVVDCYKNGLTMTQIGMRYNLNRMTISKILKEYGISVRTYGSKFFSEEEKTIIFDGYASGKHIATLAKGLKIDHYAVRKLLIEHGYVVPIKKTQSGNSYLNEKDRYVNIILPADDPYFAMAGASGALLEHRYVMAKHLGRLLEKYETVHHKNGNKKDNQIENLQLRSSAHGPGVATKCNACGSYDIEFIPLSEES